MKLFFPDGFGTRALLAFVVVLGWVFFPETPGIEAAAGATLGYYFSSRQSQHANGGPKK